MITEFKVKKLKDGAVVPHYEQVFKLETHGDSIWKVIFDKAIEALKYYYLGDLGGKADGYENEMEERVRKCTNGSDSIFHKEDTIDIHEDQSFNQIQILFTGTSEDDLKHECDTIIIKPKDAEVVSEGLSDDNYKVEFKLYTSKLSNGKYTFSCGAQDDGWHEDFANISTLNINFIKG